jgi:hypothetical protein
VRSISFRVGRGFGRPTFSGARGSGGSPRTSTHPTKLLVFAFLLLFPSSSTAQSPTPFASVSADQKRIQLSESVRATMVITGAAPLRVELPKKLLVPESDRDWKIQPLDRAKVVPLLGLPGLECWVQTFRLDPFVTGNTLPIEFAPMKVNGKEITPPGLEMTVLSSLSEVKPESARPVTGIEELPDPLIVEHSLSPWWLLLGPGVIVIGCLLWRMRRKPKPISPEEWAAMGFDRLEREGFSGAALVDGTAMVLRGFIDRRYGIPAPKLTTAEVLVAAKQAGWTVEISESLLRLLEICDRAKFAGDIPDDDGCRDLLAGGRDWINRICSDSRPG